MNGIVRYDTGYVTHPGNCRTVNQDNLLLRRGAVDGQDFLLLADAVILQLDKVVVLAENVQIKLGRFLRLLVVILA